MAEPSELRASAERYSVGDLVVDVVRERVTRGEVELTLSKLSFDLLASLVHAAPGWVSIETLMREVWPRLVVGPETVVQRVKLVRSALGDRADAPRYIAAARGRGYRIVAPVAALDSLPDAGPVTASAQLPKDYGLARFFRRHGRSIAGAAGAGVVVACAIVWLAREPVDAPAVAAPVVNARVVAATPSGLSRDPVAADLYLQGLVARNAAAARSVPEAALRRIETLFDAAIRRDPSFADAYSERAAVRIALKKRNIDVSDELVRAIRTDVAMAAQLAPTAAKTHAARAWLMAFIDEDDAGAARELAAAQAVGLDDPMWILDMSRVLERLGRHDEAMSALDRARTLDPGNAATAKYFARTQLALREPRDALREIDLALGRDPTAFDLAALRSFILFSETGALDPMRELAATEAGSTQLAFMAEFLRLSGQFERLEHMLRDAQESAPPATRTAVEIVERHLGWLALLRGDRVSAAAHGDALLEWLTTPEAAAIDAELRGLLAAEAHTFTGDRALALDAARRRAATAPFAAAMVYAWNGAHDEAAKLLEEVVSSHGAPGPATIAREPLLTVPLADNLRFRALIYQLETEMRPATLD